MAQWRERRARPDDLTIQRVAPKPLSRDRRGIFSISSVLRCRSGWVLHPIGLLRGRTTVSKMTAAWTCAGLFSRRLALKKADRHRMPRALALAVTIVLALSSSPAGTQASTDRHELASVSVGDSIGCAVSVEGTVACWGTTHSGPLQPPAGSFTHVSAASYHACGLRSDQTLACWGDWHAGIGRTPPGAYRSVDVGGNDDSCAVTADGALSCWDYYGSEPYPEPAPTGSFVAVSVGGSHACAIAGDGAIACWGDDSTGQAPATVAGAFSKVSAGGGFTCAIDSASELRCWGRSFAAYDYAGAFTDVSAGQDHVCALRADGGIACWGSDFDGQIYAPAGSYSRVAAGTFYSCAERIDRELVCWGATRHRYLLPAMGSGTVPAATVEREYAWRFYGVVQSPVQTFRVTSGSLPPGVSLSTDGRLSGTPTSIGTWAATVHASNGIGPDYEQAFDAVVNPIPVFRLAGADRFATSAAVSAATWGGRPTHAFIATGSNFPDALSAAAAAGGDFGRGPVLLVTRDSIPTSVASELARLRPYRIVVIGGTGVVSTQVEQALRSYASTGEVTRLAGADRYATSAAISARFFPERVKRAFIATGADFPDALAGAAAAGTWNSPLLLVKSDEIPPQVVAELRRLQPQRIYILGGRSVLGPNIEGTLNEFHPDVVRLAGADRYATAAAVSQVNYVLGAKRVYLATGANFPDALTAAAAAGIHDSPLLLTRPSSLPAVVTAELERLKPGSGFIVGGSSVVSSAVQEQLKHYVAR